MSLDAVLVFLHVVGATGLLATIAVEAACLVLLVRAGSAEEARAVLRLLSLDGRLAPVAMLTTLGSGAWMMSRGWGAQPWIFGGLATLAWIGVTGALARRRLAPLRSSLERGTAHGEAAGPPVPPALAVPWHRAGAGLAALALMTLQPGAAASAMVLVAGIGLGALATAGSPLRSSRPPRRENRRGQLERAG